MNLSVYQRKCLDKMGISLYEYQDPTICYWLCVCEPLLLPHRELLAKMITALKWPAAKCRTFETLEQAKNQPLPQKIIIFGESFQDYLNLLKDPIPEQCRVCLPSLQTLMGDVKAKKEAWSKMQVLIEF